MLPWRVQPPVHSPLTAGALSAGALQRAGAAARLESVLAADYVADRVVTCASGTDALSRAIRAAGGAGGVALPAFACYDLVTAAVGASASMCFYDVDPATLSPDLDSLERALATGARVVVVAHLYGVPVAWDDVVDAVRPFGAAIIEDAAQGHGGAWRGRPLGTLGDWSVVSFGRGKAWTGSRGGALLLRGPAVHAAARAADVGGPADELRTWAGAFAQWVAARPDLYGIPASIPALGLGETHYREPSEPAPLPSTAAAMLLASRERARAEAAMRRAALARYERELSGAEGIALPSSGHRAGDCGALRAPVLVRGGIASLVDGRARRLGVMSAYPRLLPDLEAAQPRLGAWQHYRGAQEIRRTLVTLPTHSLLSDGERAQVIRLVRQVAGTSVGAVAHDASAVPATHARLVATERG